MNGTLSSLTAAQKVILDKVKKETAILVKIDGKAADGQDAYVYLAVSTQMYEDFVKAYHEKPIELEDWGVIVESGYGEPSDEVKKQMEEEYHFNHQSILKDEVE